jgi:cytochrome c biogenesis protein CcmG, thiol:disulfide interchange protein DsbE
MPTKPQHPTKTPRLQSKKWARWIVVTVAALGLIAVFATLSQSPTPEYAFSTESLTGDKVSLTDYRGKVVMLNFWATWCPPCRAEMPLIESTYEQYGKRGFIVLAVNNAERADQVASFASQYKLTFPVLLDYTADIQQQFAIKGYPTSLFLDAQGKVYATHQGMVNAAQLVSYIETGLQRSASS